MPGDVAPRGGLRIAAAHHDLLDGLRLDAGAVERVTDGVGGQIRPVGQVQRPAMRPADGRAGGGDDHGVGHRMNFRAVDGWVTDWRMLTLPGGTRVPSPVRERDRVRDPERAGGNATVSRRPRDPSGKFSSLTPTLSRTGEEACRVSCARTGMGPVRGSVCDALTGRPTRRTPCPARRGGRGAARGAGSRPPPPRRSAPGRPRPWPARDRPPSASGRRARPASCSR